MTTDNIVLEQYNPEWTKMASDEIEHLKKLLPIGTKRTHHVHIYEEDCSQWLNKIIFRDYLIKHPDLLQEYGNLKRALAEVHAQDRERYTEAKTAFVEKVLNLAKL